jgi:cation transport ATPase
MKTILMLVSVLGVLASSTAFASAHLIDVSVKGIFCSSCAKEMRSLFRSQTAVQTASVDMKKGLLHLTMKDGQDLSDDQIKQLVSKDPDFSVEKIQRK